ncbi:MAG: TonB-dependent receptor [Betaproteobacteria bacterium]|nr:TonB-dependent receptor [Betaproteobacteria bacterium]
MKYRLQPSWASRAALCALPLCLAATGNACAGNDTPDLTPITVLSSRFDETPAQSLPQTTLITADQIAQSGLTDVSQILQKLGNVPTRINLNGTQDQSIDLRGYGITSDNNVVVLLDGVRLSEIEQASARTSMIPVESIDHIEIFRGGSSVLYGEGATSGIINIVSKNHPGNSAVASAGAGSFATKEGNVWASRQVDNTSIALFGKAFNTDNYRANNQAQVRTGGAALQWQPDATRTLGVRLYSDSEDTHFPGPLTLAQFQQNPRQTFTPFDAGAISGNAVTVFGKAIYDRTELAFDANVRNKQSSANLPSLGGDTRIAANYTGLSPRARIHDAFVHGNELAVGIDLSRWDRTYSSVYPAYPQYSTLGEHLIQNSSAVYARDDWNLTPMDRLIAGVRSERIQKEVASTDSSNLSAFELQYVRTLFSSVESYLRTGQSYRVANIDELRGAAANLQPQTSMDYEAGITWNRLAPSNATLRVFRSDIHNELVFDPVQYINVNLPPTQREGLELEGRYQMVPELALRGSGQWIRATFVDGPYQGHRVPLVPLFNIQAGGEWKPWERQTVDLSARFVGPQAVDSDFLGAYAPIPYYWTADLRYNSTISKQWSLVASANNLLNRQYYDYANSYGGYYPSPGRALSLLAKYRF